MVYLSKANEQDWKYPAADARKDGHVIVSKVPPHKIYYHEYGNPDGEPVMFFHGGPGGATSRTYARFFDPERYRIILFDQRGCGKSEPLVSDNPEAALRNNTTDHTIEDTEKLRKALKIEGKMHVFGGSWGSTLAMAYAIKHPENVESLVLRGIYLGRKKDLDFFYQGNAANYEKNPHDTPLPGTYLTFPDEWKEFVEIIPPEKRSDMVKAYGEIFTMKPATEEERKLQDRAAIAWSKWEGATSYVSQKTEADSKYEDVEFARNFAKIENHYFMNGCFLGSAGETNRENNYLIDNAEKIAHIPTYIVQGRYDQVCPRFQADELVFKLRSYGADVHYVTPPAGHSMLERENAAELTRFMDDLPLMKAQKKELPRKSDISITD